MGEGREEWSPADAASRQRGQLTPSHAQPWYEGPGHVPRMGLGCGPGAAFVCGCLDLRDGPQQEGKGGKVWAVADGSFAFDLHVEWRGQVESWKGLHQSLGWRVLGVMTDKGSVSRP